jgi:2Fe-2S ferredoxin
MGNWYYHLQGEVLVPTIVYVDAADASEHVVEAEIGETLMEAAVRSGVPGIIGECGGNASCATCHVWVRAEFAAKVGEPPPGGLEDDLLDLGVDERRGTSRLGCQITVSDALDGLTVEVPPQNER